MTLRARVRRRHAADLPLPGAGARPRASCSPSSSRRNPWCPRTLPCARRATRDHPAPRRTTGPRPRGTSATSTARPVHRREAPTPVSRPPRLQRLVRRQQARRAHRSAEPSSTTTAAAFPRAALTLIDTGGRQVGRGATGEDGRYALSTPGAGSYVLIAAARGHQPQAVTVTVGERPVELDVVLGGAGRLAGSVLTADGHPVADAAVTLTDVARRRRRRHAQRTGRRLRHRGPGGRRVHPRRSRARLPPGRAAGLRAGGARDPQDIELAGGAVLRGTVRAHAAAGPSRTPASRCWTRPATSWTPLTTGGRRRRSASSTCRPASTR